MSERLRPGSDATLQERSKRVEFFDAVKGVAIVAIVAGHIIGALRYEGMLVGEWVRPTLDLVLLSGLAAFYFVAGVFLAGCEKKPFGKFLSSKITQLAVPYVVFTILQGGIESIASRWVHEERSFGELLRTMWHDPYWQFWFLYVLFIASLFAWCVQRVGITPRGVVIVALMLRLASPLVAPWNWSVLQRAMDDFIWIALGMWAGRGFVPMPKAWGSLPLGSGAVTAAAVAVMATLLASGRYMVLAVVGGSYAILSASAALAMSPAMKWAGALGRASLAIYLLHVIVMGGAKVVLRKGLPEAGWMLNLSVRLFLALLVPLALRWLWLEALGYLRSRRQRESVPEPVLGA